MEDSSIKKEIGLYVDIEGFSVNFQNGSLNTFVSLANDLFTLANERLLFKTIIQYGGDGFLIKEVIARFDIFKEFVDIGVVLLQSMCLHGGVGRIHISNGWLADISSKFSEGLQKHISNNDFAVNKNTFTFIQINPLIGTSLINCHNLKGPKGPLMLIDVDFEESLKEEKIDYIDYRPTFNSLAINWLKYSSAQTFGMLNILGLNRNNITSCFKNYIDSQVLSEEWKNSAQSLLN